ncbi:UDP-N-acetylglucosamine transferase subunit [Exophiala xenobiotica]|uniref:UDP-N-acetylglucosamine transferase subunit ALG14 n=1 Tax=Lithohypha guttulata TaxID=1690604 RepID=A0ABR0KDR7_9EURO|nr:UDP-N-acetylglucosamine transferase subunit [Lithohypha guttulata]KAK5318351.1 UDP-N-acetylglucosamine transferase subunit [Exophiala xenobiotica]
MDSLVVSFRRGARRVTLLVSRYRYALLQIAGSYVLVSLILFAVFRLAIILHRPKPEEETSQDASRPKRRKGHLLIVLGSGGHTSEMLCILQNLGAEYLDSRFDKRTWVVSSGDSFSAERAKRFEDWIGQGRSSQSSWDIITVHRARKIHQPLYTAPALRGTHRDLKSTPNGAQSNTGNGVTTSYPDLILANGPATAVVLILASLVLIFLGLAPINPGREEGGAMRSIYIESWARVKTLSLSGKILRFVAGRFLVQWRGLEDVDLTKVSQGPDGDDVDVEVEQNGKSKLWSRKIEHVGTVVA